MAAAAPAPAPLVPGGSVTDTITVVNAALAGGRRQLALQVEDYTAQLKATFAALRKKHFP